MSRNMLTAAHALKAIAATDPEKAETNVANELEWQSQHLPEHLREEMMSRLIVEKRNLIRSQA
jgi:predicted transcriptional regulator